MPQFEAKPTEDVDNQPIPSDAAIVKAGEANLAIDHQKAARQAMKELTTIHHPRFYHVNDQLTPEVMACLTPEELESARDALVAQIGDCFRVGHWSGLDGAIELMNKLGLQAIELPQETTDLINDLLSRDSHYGTWTSLALSINPGRGPDDPYLSPEEETPHKRQRARNFLVNNLNFQPEELTDEKMDQIIILAETLIQLTYTRMSHVERQLPGETIKMLEAPRE